MKSLAPIISKDVHLLKKAKESQKTTLVINLTLLPCFPVSKVLEWYLSSSNPFYTQFSLLDFIASTSIPSLWSK